MLFRKLWRTMGLYKAQFFSMVLMIALGIAVFIGFNIEWYSIQENTNQFFDETGFADYRIISETGFTKEEAEMVEKISGVDAVSRYVSINVDVKEKTGDSLALTVTENADVSGFIVSEGNGYDENSKDGIWLSVKYADANQIAVGDKLTLSYSNKELCATVQGLIRSGEHMICVRDESQLMPDYETFGFAYISPAFYKEAVGFAYYPQINVISGLSKAEFVEKADEALNKTLLILTKEETISYAGASGEAEEGKMMGTILPALFLLIAFLTMVTTMHRITAKEKTQIGTLKALGFKNRKIIVHYMSYAVMIGVIGCALGILLGHFIAWMIMNPNGMMGTYLDMPYWRRVIPGFCYLVMAAILVLISTIGFLSVKEMLRGSAADALRPYTPKQMKALFVERWKCFHKLSFGVRWNLRDIIRHKSRTFMTLLGVVGSMVIIVCALGMQDTMDKFMELYYDDAINYSSRIYLAENVTKEETEALAQKYEGDWSASVSVQIEEKAVSLDIYCIGHDKVRFLGEDNETIPVPEDGAYICMRIAEEYDLEIGDTFTVSPYGTNREYQMRVAGVMRSVAENMVISAKYADSIGISYVPNSVYTDAQKEDIEVSGFVKSIQSKQMIVDSFDSFMQIMDMMIVILVVAALLLSVIVLYNLGVMSYTERSREMATLKVVGFKDKKIGRLLVSQNVWVSVIGILIGIPAGLVMLDFIIKSMASEYEMKVIVTFTTYLIGAVLTMGVSLLVSVMVSAKNKKIDMVEALKSAE